MWLIEQSAGARLAEIYRQDITFSDAQIAAFTVESLHENASPSDGIARINVTGVLTKQRDIFARLFGGGNTAYTDIQAQLLAAESDPNVKSIEMFIDSPGGSVDGLFETLAVIEAVEKKIKVTAANAMSAAYAIAAAAGPIQATNVASMIGSVGVVVQMFTPEDIVTLTNTESPEKRPDPNTPEGKASVVKFLDSIHDLLVDAIATGRDTSKQNVLDRFGKGAILLASEAKKRGMIDSVRKTNLKAVASASNSMEIQSMDLNKLKAEFPEVYEAAVTAGRSAEKDRVTAHLTLGKQSGAMDVAIKAIEEGSELTQSLTATYLARGLAKRDVETRQEDSADADAATNDAEPRPDADTDGLTVAALVEKQLGIAPAEAN